MWTNLVVLGSLCFPIALQLSVAMATYAAETNLRASLRAGYDQEVRPSSPTTLTTAFSIRSLRDLDIATETMETTGWFTFLWYDSRLAWNPGNYSNLKALEIDWTWRPKFIISNRVDKVSTMGQEDTVVRVYSNGFMRWLIPLLIKSSCSVDITLFPFDTQKCFIDIMFWNSDDNEISIILLINETDAASFIPSGEWDLIGSISQVQYRDIGEQIPTVTHSITFKRKRPYYVINLLLPSLMMSICIIWTFLLPVDSGERIGYAITIMLTYTVLMTITSDLLPSTSSQTPHIASYLLIVLMFSLAAVALSVVNVKLYFKEGNPPKAIQKGFRFLGNVVLCDLCCTKTTSSVSPEDQPDENSMQQRTKQKPGAKVPLAESRDQHEADADGQTEAAEITWRLVSEILDRIWFYLYLTGIGIYDVILLAALQGNDIREVHF